MRSYMTTYAIGASGWEWVGVEVGGGSGLENSNLEQSAVLPGQRLLDSGHATHAMAKGYGWERVGKHKSRAACLPRQDLPCCQGNDYWTAAMRHMQWRKGRFGGAGLCEELF